MGLDMAGAMIIGTACSMLFMRIVLAVVKVRTVHEARTVHHTKQKWLPARLYDSAARQLERIPVRLRLALALGSISVVVGLAHWNLEGFLPGSGTSRALLLALRWGAFAMLIKWVRSWGAGMVGGGRPGALGRARAPRGGTQPAAT